MVLVPRIFFSQPSSLAFQIYWHSRFHKLSDRQGRIKECNSKQKKKKKLSEKSCRLLLMIIRYWASVYRSPKSSQDYKDARAPTRLKQFVTFMHPVLQWWRAYLGVWRTLLLADKLLCFLFKKKNKKKKKPSIIRYVKKSAYCAVWWRKAEPCSGMQKFNNTKYCNQQLLHNCQWKLSKSIVLFDYFVDH